jgi:hypothetical protein
MITVGKIEQLTNNPTPFPERIAALHHVRSEPLLAAAVVLKAYLESTACAVDGFDIPDAIWMPFADAVEAANA